MQKTFIQLANEYSDDTEFIHNCWNEIESYYTKPNRHYHTLSHLEDLYQHLFDIKDKITNWNLMLFSIYYHDVIYNPANSNNEEQSADLAIQRMAKLGVSFKEIELCKNQILATKSHKISNDLDTNCFIDADLSILGRDWDTYNTYCENIRKEYSIYPNFLYKQGRKKVIQHFLNMKRIYKTNIFFKRYEKQAKDNLEKELKSI